MRGKPWTTQEEKQLKALVSEGKSLDAIAGALGKTIAAVYAKMNGIGLRLKEEESKTNQLSSSSKTAVPKELPTIEETLKIMTRAIDALKQPGILRNEILRMRSLIQATKVCPQLFAFQFLLMGFLHESTKNQPIHAHAKEYGCWIHILDS
jgi:hypothetical protein